MGEAYTSRRARITARDAAWLAAVGGVVLLAAVLRLDRLDLIDFRFDSASAMQQAMQIAQGRLALVAQLSGSVINHPPVFLYLLAIPYVFTKSFTAIVTYRILLDVAVVGLCAWIGARYFNRRIGLIGALLLACAPWGVQMSRTMGIVTPPLFSALVFIGLLAVMCDDSPRGWILTGIGLALSVGSHWSAVYLIPAVVAVCLIKRRSLSRRALAWAFAPSLIPLLLYAGHEAAHGFANITAITSTPPKLQAGPSVFEVVARLSGASQISVLAGKSFDHWLAEFPANGEWLDWLQLLMLVLGVVACLWIVWHGRRRLGEDRMARAIATLALWMVIPVALQLRPLQFVTMHYMLMLYPAMFLAVGVGVDWALRWLAARDRLVRGAGSAAIVAAVVLMAGWHVYVTIFLNGFVERYDTNGGYGLPVRSLLAAADQARRARSELGLGDVIAVVDGHDLPWNEQAVIMRVALADVPVRMANAQSEGIITRPEGAHYVIAPEAVGALDQLRQWEGVTTADGTATMPLPQLEGRGYTYARARPPNLGAFTPAPVARWPTGVELSGYRLVPGAQPGALRFDAVLTVMNDPPADSNYHWFAHAFSGSQATAQRDGQGIHPVYWRTGDRLLLSFDLDRGSPAPTNVQLGSYTYPDVQRVPVQFADGRREGSVALPVDAPR